MLCYAMQNVYKKISGGGDGNDKGENMVMQKDDNDAEATVIAMRIAGVVVVWGSYSWCYHRWQWW